ncbi:MAG: sulfotransferase, partial [Steroidobacteraceae bacterium]
PGTVDLALAHAARLLGDQPALAAEQAREILKLVPRHAGATLMLGLALGRAGHGEKAVATLREALRLDPTMPEAWLALGDHLGAMGDRRGATEAYTRHLRHATRDPRLMQAAAALAENRIPEAEALLREHLKALPTDTAAIRMLAEVAARLGRYGDAQKLLERCLELAPEFSAARHNYALVLHRLNQPEAALREVDRLLASDARNPGYRNLKAAILGRIGEYGQALEFYAGVLADYPNQPRVWMSYGHALKTAGNQAESVKAYRRCSELAPGIGEAWWSLANLKTLRFTTADIEAMQAQLERIDISEEDRFHFHFALGKALEDAGEYATSFSHYARGNALRRAAIHYDADENAKHVRRSKKTLTRQFFDDRHGFGDPSPDPIFIVGLPRSGSTLLEQILASHPAVEGTMELPDIGGLARMLGSHTPGTGGYPEVLATLGREECAALGERYLSQTRIQRKTAAPFFIDKMPNNFAHVGLIHLILPRASIIDARRHPLGCCFSCFKQHFARGQHFTYSLEEIGRYYRDYVELMAHFDSVLPGRVHRVIYESLVDDTETQVRSVLDYCGLPFDARCLQFHANARAVRTASSEQVRQPIFREGVDHWRHYEPWLDPLKQALGPVLESYPDVAVF